MARTPNVSGIVSLRLTPEEGRRVKEAAAVKGWKVAHFLRVSALERAAHVLNLSRPTSFDFGGTARRVAEAVMAERKVEVRDGVGTLIGTFGEGRLDSNDGLKNFDFAVDVSELELRKIAPKALDRQEMDMAFEALRLGGLDFAEQLLVECRRIAAVAADPSLPPPIDPATARNGESE